MDEAARCDEPVPMRDGAVLAQETPRAPRPHGSGRHRRAFLTLVRGAGETAAGTVNAARTLATTRRVLTQLRRDPRTIAMLLVVPMVLLWLLDLVFDGQP